MSARRSTLCLPLYTPPPAVALAATDWHGSLRLPEPLLARGAPRALARRAAVRHVGRAAQPRGPHLPAQQPAGTRPAQGARRHALPAPSARVGESRAQGVTSPCQPLRLSPVRPLWLPALPCRSSLHARPRSLLGRRLTQPRRPPSLLRPPFPTAAYRQARRSGYPTSAAQWRRQSATATA